MSRSKKKSKTKNKKIVKKATSSKTTKKASKKKVVKKSVKKAVTKKKVAPKASVSSLKGVSKQQLLHMHDLMVKSRVLEERLIQIYKMGEAYFWIGGPGEEAFGVPLGLLVDKGQGPDHDFLHLHYRCTPTLIAMGMEMIDATRLIMNRATDRSTGGRNFAGHYCYPEWNIVPVTSPIETQYAMAIGTAWAQKRGKAKGLTVVSGGDAGTAEGEFASCLIWSTRKGQELPMLMTVQNNRWGISTSYDTQHGEASIADRGKAFGMRTAVYNGNDPVESYLGLQSELEYIRKTRKPCLVEFNVSRLNNHSSASGANRETGVEDCLESFEEKLLKAGHIKESEIKKIWKDYEEEARAAMKQSRGEPAPTADSIWDHTYVGGENADWRNF